MKGGSLSGKYKHYSRSDIFNSVSYQSLEFVMRQWYKHVVVIETTSNSSTKDSGMRQVVGM